MAGARPVAVGRAGMLKSRVLQRVLTSCWCAAAFAETAAAVAASSVADESFDQFSSTRFYVQGAQVPQAFRGPFVIVNTTAVTGLMTPSPSTQPLVRSVWALTAEGTLVSIQADAMVMPIRSATPLPVASLAASTAQGAVLVERGSPGRSNALHWLQCSADLHCSVVATAFLPLNDDSALVCLAVDPLHSTAFVGTSDGLFVGDRATKQLVRQHVPAFGTSVTSLSFSAGVLAIGTVPAVFHCQLEPGGSLGKCDHQLVSALIDDIPTALTLWNDYLYIGNNLSASAWHLEGGQVERISGAQGLPTANITSMLPSGDALWVGHAQGISLSNLSARRTEPQQREYWRYFNGDRYLPGERVTAIALPAGASSSQGPSVWAATRWGLALIESKAQTLASKAITMEAKLRPLDRYGWHGPVRIPISAASSVKSQLFQSLGQNQISIPVGMAV